MAIAFDSVAHGAANGASSLTVSHTCTGANRILVVFIDATVGLNVENITGITYNGVAMTQIRRFFYTTNSENIEAWYLINPSTGANNIIASFSPNTPFGVELISVSYTGANQSAQPDASPVGTTHVSSTTFVQSITTVADNAWALYVAVNGGGFFDSFSAGATSRFIESSGVGARTMGVGDSNAALTPPGSYSGQANRAAGSDWAGLVVSIAPVASAAAVNNRRALLGVGT